MEIRFHSLVCRISYRQFRQRDLDARSFAIEVLVSPLHRDQSVLGILRINKGCHQRAIRPQMSLHVNSLKALLADIKRIMRLDSAWKSQFLASLRPARPDSIHVRSQRSFSGCSITLGEKPLAFKVHPLVASLSRFLGVRSESKATISVGKSDVRHGFLLFKGGVLGSSATSEAMGSVLRSDEDEDCRGGY